MWGGEAAKREWEGERESYITPGGDLLGDHEEGRQAGRKSIEVLIQPFSFTSSNLSLAHSFLCSVVLRHLL